jgi:hypothetical protein
MGALLAQLTRMGLENIGYELITDVKTFNKNGPRKVFDTTGDEFALEWVKQHPSFQIIDLVNHFREQGRNGASAYPAVRKLVESKLLRKIGSGNYQHANVKALAPPEKTETTKQRPANPVARFEVKNWDVILKLIKNKTKFKIADLTNAFVEQGRNPKSVSPITTNMAKQKLIRIIAPGEYEVIKSGIEKALAKAKTPKAAAKEARNKADRDRRAQQKKADAPEHSPNPSLNGSSEKTEVTEAVHG